MAIASNFLDLARLAEKAAARKAPYDDALALAQRNATRPVSEGGLGLPAGNTAMERAAEMGAQAHFMRPGAFNGPRLPLTDSSSESLFFRFGNIPKGGKSRHVQHGFDEGGVSTMGRIDRLGSGNGITPWMAESYIIGGNESVGMGARPLYVIRGKQSKARGSDGEPLVESPVVVREGTPHERAQLYTDIDRVARLGDDARGLFNAEIPNYSTLLKSLPNGQLRSSFAAFDPFRRGEPDLLASLAPWLGTGIGTAGLYGGSTLLPDSQQPQASYYSALADLYKSVGKKLPWTERELMSGLPKGRGVAPQDLALEAARREAEAMGLPASNTAADRAALIGLDEPMYHGTKSNFDAFQLDKSHPGLSVNAVSLSNDPQHASHYSTLAGRSGGNVIPVVADMGRTGQLFDLQDARGSAAASGLTSAQELEAKGIDSIKMDGGAVNYILDPSRIRSRFAAMNPALKDSSNLLAGLGLAAVGAGAAMAPGEAEAGIAGPLAKTADLAALKIAQKADAAGLPMAKVYDATGWTKGADGKWRWEFDDSGAKFNITPATGQENPLTHGYGDMNLGSVTDIMLHPELAKAYSGAEIAPKTFVKDSMTMLNSERGAFNPEDKAITLYAPATSDQAKSTLLHETQHAIQQREGFAQGGNQEQFVHDDAIAAFAMKYLRSTPEYKDALKARDQWWIDNPVGGNKESWKKLIERNPVFQREASLSDRIQNKWKDPSGTNRYTRLAGEVEARNVQTRMGMMPDERRMRPFFETEDVPRSQQIVQGQSGQSAYAEMMDLKRAADARARTHGPRASMTPGAEAVREMAIEAMNPASWPLLWGSRELGDPQARDYSNTYYSYSGSRR